MTMDEKKMAAAALQATEVVAQFEELLNAKQTWEWRERIQSAVRAAFVGNPGLEDESGNYLMMAFVMQAALYCRAQGCPDALASIALIRALCAVTEQQETVAKQFAENSN